MLNLNMTNDKIKSYCAIPSSKRWDSMDNKLCVNSFQSMNQSMNEVLRTGENCYDIYKFLLNDDVLCTFNIIVTNEAYKRHGIIAYIVVDVVSLSNAFEPKKLSGGAIYEAGVPNTDFRSAIKNSIFPIACWLNGNYGNSIDMDSSVIYTLLNKVDYRIGEKSEVDSLNQRKLEEIVQKLEQIDLLPFGGGLFHNGETGVLEYSRFSSGASLTIVQILEKIEKLDIFYDVKDVSSQEMLSKGFIKIAFSLNKSVIADVPEIDLKSIPSHSVELSDMRARLQRLSTS